MYPGRGVLNTPHNHSRKGYLIARQTIWGRIQYAPTLPAEKSNLKGWREVMFGTMADKYVFHSIMSNRLSDGYPGRAQKNMPLARLSSTLSPLAERLVGRMQYAPTLSEKDKVSLGRCFLLSRTRGDKSVFHFSMSNRLSDGYPGRGVLHTPLARLSSTPSPLAGRLVGRMQYAPTLPAEKSDLKGWREVMSETRGDEYVFHSTMSNRLSDRYPCRAQKHTPLARLSSTLSPISGRLVGRMQYASTLPAEKSDFKGWCGVMFGTMRDKSVFHFFMSNRLSDRYPCRGVKAYATCAFIVYPHAPCRAFGRAYAIRPYISGKR